MEQPSNKVSVTAADAGEQIKRHLSKDGYVVVTDLYTPPQCLAMQEEFTELAQKLHPEWVDEQGTFHFKHDEFLASFKGGMGHCGPVNHQVSCVACMALAQSTFRVYPITLCC